MEYYEAQERLDDEVTFRSDLRDLRPPGGGGLDVMEAGTTSSADVRGSAATSEGSVGRPSSALSGPTQSGASPSSVGASSWTPGRVLGSIGTMLRPSFWSNQSMARTEAADALLSLAEAHAPPDSMEAFPLPGLQSVGSGARLPGAGRGAWLNGRAETGTVGGLSVVSTHAYGLGASGLNGSVPASAPASVPASARFGPLRPLPPASGSGGNGAITNRDDFPSRRNVDHGTSPVSGSTSTWAYAPSAQSRVSPQSEPTNRPPAQQPLPTTLTSADGFPSTWNADYGMPALPYPVSGASGYYWQQPGQSLQRGVNSQGRESAPYPPNGQRVFINEGREGPTPNNSWQNTRVESVSTRKHQPNVKLPTFSGNTSLETFLAKFQYIARFLQWSEEEKLFHISSCLDGPAGHALWDAGPQTSFDSMVNLLRARFGQQGQAERYRAELKARKRKSNETLQELYQDICRLIALAYPQEPGSVSSAILARNAFMDALDNHRLYTRVLEKEPQTIEAALTEACKLEAIYASRSGKISDDDDVETGVSEGRRRDRRVRSMRSNNRGDAVPGPSSQQKPHESELSEMMKQMTTMQKQINEAIHKQVTEPMQKQIVELQQEMRAITSAQSAMSHNGASDPGRYGYTQGNIPNVQWQAAPSNYPAASVQTSYTGMMPNQVPHANVNAGFVSHDNSAATAAPSTGNGGQSHRYQTVGRGRNFRCHGCNQVGHFVRDCPNKPAENEPQVPSGGNAYRLRHAEIFVRAKYRGKNIHCLLDSGADRSLIASELVAHLPKRPAHMQLLAANGTAVPVLGEVDIGFAIEGIPVTANLGVADAIEGVILGNDWLSENNCTWEFGKSKLQLLGHVVKTRCKLPCGYVRRVYVAEDYTVPAGHQATVPVKMVLNRLPRECHDYAVEPKPVKQGVVTARTVMSGKTTEAALQVVNYSNKPYFFHAATFVGIAEPVQVLEGNVDDDVVIGNVDNSVVVDNCVNCNNMHANNTDRTQHSPTWEQEGQTLLKSTETESACDAQILQSGYLPAFARQGHVLNQPCPGARAGSNPMPALPVDACPPALMPTIRTPVPIETAWFSRPQLTGVHDARPQVTFHELRNASEPRGSDCRATVAAGNVLSSSVKGSIKQGLSPGGSRPSVFQTTTMVATITSVPDEYAHVQCIIDGLPSDLEPDERIQAIAFIKSYAHVFSKGEFDIGRTHILEHTIDTGDHKPIKQPLRRHPAAHLPIIDQHVEDMLRNDIIEPAASPWSSNVVLIKKKDNTLRFCIDYRALNSCTYRDNFPLARIDACLEALGGSKFYSTMDLRSGYWQTVITESDRDKTSFCTRKGQWRFKVLSFGLCNAPSQFARIMELVLSGLTYESCLVYLDDVVCYGRTILEHTTRLEAVLKRLEQANLKLKASKCHFFQRKAFFLAHVADEEGIHCDPRKVEDIVSWPVPRNLTEVKSFVGLASYYRSFIRGFADLARPLNDLSRKGAKFIWGDRQMQAFEALKSCLISAPVLAPPRDEGTYVLDTDASDVAVGYVLQQEQDGQLRVIAYASKALSDAERRYCTTRKELLAVVYGLKRFRQHLLGRDFIIRTDHAALAYLLKTPEPLGQQGRWLDLISEYSFTLRHRPGLSGRNADSMSRRPPCLRDNQDTCKQCKLQVNPGDRQVGLVVRNGELTHISPVNYTPVVSCETVPKQLCDRGDEDVSNVLSDGPEVTLLQATGVGDVTGGCADIVVGPRVVGAGCRDECCGVEPSTSAEYNLSSNSVAENRLRSQGAERPIDPGGGGLNLVQWLQTGRVPSMTFTNSNYSQENCRVIDANKPVISTCRTNSYLPDLTNNVVAYQTGSRQMDAVHGAERIFSPLGYQTELRKSQTIAENTRNTSRPVDYAPVDQTDDRGRLNHTYSVDQTDNASSVLTQTPVAAQTVSKPMGNTPLIPTVLRDCESVESDPTGSFFGNHYTNLVNNRTERRDDDWSVPPCSSNSADSVQCRPRSPLEREGSRLAEGWARGGPERFGGSASVVAASRRPDVYHHGSCEGAEDQRTGAPRVAVEERCSLVGEAYETQPVTMPRGSETVSREGRTGVVVGLSGLEDVAEASRLVAAARGRTTDGETGSGAGDAVVENVDASSADAGRVPEVGPDHNSSPAAVAVDDDIEIRADAFSLDNIKVAQQSDYSIKAILKLLTEHETQPPWNDVQNSGEEVRILWGQYESLVVRDDVLYRRFYKPDGVDSHLQVILPGPLRKTYIMHVHCASGHFGVAKVTAEIAKRVYFPGWKSLAVMVLRTCDVCNRYRRGEAPKQTFLRPFLASRPMDLLQVDLVGPLVEGKKANGQRGYYYILTAIDVYSKFLFTTPLKNKTAEVVAAAIVEILLRVGLCSRLQSDLGLEFQAKILQDVNRMLGIHQLRGTSLKPTTQACVERVHRSMHAMFAKCAMEKQSDWPEVLPAITLAYNMAVHSSTKYTPYFLFHGREAVCPLDLLTPVPDETEPVDVHEYAVDLTERLRYAFDFVQKFAQTRMERMKKAYDTHVKPKTFVIGQLVYYYYPRKRQNKYNKWQSNYLGVYKIIKVLNSTNCIIQRTPRSQGFVTHFDKLRAYLGTTPVIWKGHQLTDNPVQVRPTCTVDTGFAEGNGDQRPPIIPGALSPRDGSGTGAVRSSPRGAMGRATGKAVQACPLPCPLPDSSKPCPLPDSLEACPLPCPLSCPLLDSAKES